MATPINKRKKGSSEYGFSTNEIQEPEDCWSGSPESRSRTESNSTPNPLQKVNNWIRSNKKNYPDSSHLGSDCNDCKSDKDFMIFRYDLDKSQPHPDEDSDFYDLPVQDKQCIDNEEKLCKEKQTKKTKLKSQRKSEGLPHFTDPVVESDVTSLDVPLSPESEQKRELCTYLQLMKPSDKKQVILLQNRRSTRVKNLCMMQERRELEKKLKEEEHQSYVNGNLSKDDPEKYPGLKSFKELNIRLDKTWLSNNKPEKTWLNYKKTDFEFPKPPSDFGKNVDDFENINFSWIKNTKKQVENTSPVKAAIKSIKIKESKVTIPIQNGNHLEKVSNKHKPEQTKIPEVKNKQALENNTSNSNTKENAYKKKSFVPITSPKQKTLSENSEKAVKIAENNNKNHTPLVVPKPLSILKDLAVDFDFVMKKKIKKLKKIDKKKVRKVPVHKSRSKRKEKKEKSQIKNKKKISKNVIKIKLFSPKVKKRKRVSGIVDSLDNGPVVKKTKIVKEEDKSKKGNKKVVRVKNKHKLGDKFALERKHRIKVLGLKAGKDDNRKLETSNILKENKKPEVREENLLQDAFASNIFQKSLQTQRRSFGNFFLNMPKVTRCTTPENLDFINEEQFNLLSKEHQKTLMKSRMPILPELSKLPFGKDIVQKLTCNSRSASPEEFIQEYSNIPKRYFELNPGETSEDSKSDISEGELQGFASDEQDFPGFDLQLPITKDVLDTKLYLTKKYDYMNSENSKMVAGPPFKLKTDHCQTELHPMTIQERLEMFSKDVQGPLSLDISQEPKTVIPFRKTTEVNSLARSLVSPRRYQGFKTNFEVQHSPQSWVPDSPSQKPKKNQHSIFISPEYGSIIKAFYVEYNLVLCQEQAVSFWTQTALGNILGAQNMWIPKGTIQRLIMDNKCIFKATSEMVVSTESNVAYIELWMKEHESNLRQRPVADVFATIYFWKKGQKGIEKKVLQLENINGFADDVKYSVLKYTSKIIVSWHTAGNQLENRATNVHCYHLAADYQTVSNITEFEPIEHYVSSLHNVEDCEGLLMGCGENKITLWNVEYGYVVATVAMTDITPPLSTVWAKCDRGFLFTLEQCADRELRLIAIKGMDGTWKKLASYVPPEEYNRLQGVCVENGLVLAIYDQGIQCWNAKTGETVVDECQSETGYISGKYVITVVNDQVHVRHAITHLLSSEDL